MSEEQIDELIEYNLEYFNEKLTDEQIANSMLDKVELETKLQEKDKEIERLNNIINELEKWLNKNLESIYSYFENTPFGVEDTYKEVLDKLKELKGKENE